MSDEKEVAQAAEEKKTRSVEIWVALIGLLGVFVAGTFAVLDSRWDDVFPKEPTATYTASPTITNTPTQTSTIAPVAEGNINTPTPKVSFMLLELEEVSRLPQILPKYSTSIKPDIFSYAVDIAPNESYRWKYYWCATDRGLLEDNLEKMEFHFLVDDEKIPEEYFLQYPFETEKWVCQAWVTMLTQWQSKSKTTFSVVLNISRPIFDGKDNYLPGEYRHDIVVTVE